MDAAILGVVATCFLALLAWLAKLSKWQGRIETKIDNMTGVKEKVEKIELKVENHEGRLHRLEEINKIN